MEKRLKSKQPFTKVSLAPNADLKSNADVKNINKTNNGNSSNSGFQKKVKAE